jgi:hypothetical protein
LQALNLQILKKVIHKAAHVLKMLNRQSEIHTAMNFTFESEVFLHSGLCTENVATPLVLEGSAIPLLPEKARSSGLPEVYSAALNAAQR